MRRICRTMVGLLLALAAVFSCLPAAGAAPAGTLLVLQAGNARALAGGSAVTLLPGQAAAVYDAGGAVLVPLRPVAERLGAAVAWDAAARRTVLTLGEHTLSFAEGSRTCQADGRTAAIPAAPRIVGASLYIPAAALTQLPGVFVHVFGYYEGAFLTVSDYPLTAGDADGAPNALFDPAAPDEALVRCRDEALRLLGPNEGLLDRSSLLLRLDSRHALAGGQDRILCGKGGGAVPCQGADGFLMVPVQACAEALGGTCSQGADGSSTVTLHGHTAVFPAAGNWVAADGVRLAHAYDRCARAADGTALCSVHAFASALGYTGSFDAASGGILLSAADLSARPELLARAWRTAEGLPLRRYEDAKGFLALTFDDGPSGPFTTRLLDGLKARGVHATFFLCNYRIQTFPGLMSRYLSEGHEVGNHSANHATLTACGAGTLAAELDATSAAIRSAAGVSPVLMRPPGGAYNQTVLAAAGQRGMSCIMWSVDTLDWKNRNVSAILQRSLPVVRDGDIILMHDMYATSVDAALSMIDTLQSQGYVFVTVSELARLKGVTLAPGVSYSAIR